MIILLLTTLITLVSYIYYKNFYNYWENLGIPTVKNTFTRVLWRFDNVHEVINDVYTRMKIDGHKYAGINLFVGKAFIPIDPELIKTMLTKDFQYFNDRGIYYDEEADPLSAHLITLSGPKWKTLRGKLAPAFTASKAKYLFESILGCGEEMISVLGNCERVEIKEILSRFTTDVIGTCGFGLECNSLRNPHSEFRRMGKRFFDDLSFGESAKVAISRLFPRLAKRMRVTIYHPEVSGFFQNVVETTVQYRERNQVVRNDLLQLLMQLKNKGQLDDAQQETKDNEKEKGNTSVLTMNEISAQGILFFLAGFETTATTISFAVFELAKNLDIQELARSEILQVLSNYDNKLTYDAITEMKYLETIVLETLRMYPPLPVFIRKCKKDYKIPNSNATIKKGLIALIPAMAMHHDPEFFDKPEEFDPDRFNDDNKHNIKDTFYLPFGDGPRICIGQKLAMLESKLALALLIKNFKFELSSETPSSLKLIIPHGVLLGEGGIWLRLTKLTN